MSNAQDPSRAVEPCNRPVCDKLLPSNPPTLPRARCPSDAKSPMEYADKMGDAVSTQARSVCLPPQAFTDAPNMVVCMDSGDPSVRPECPPPKSVIEDTRPPRISECKEPPASYTNPADHPGVCSSAGGADAGEVRCCIKKCEVSPEIFEKDPCALPTPDGPLTSDFYKTTPKLPFRFNNASGFTSYGCQQKPPVHPFYRTTSQEYGWFRPSMHTVPTGYFPVNMQFTKYQGIGGRYMNTSLDTAIAEKLVEF